MTISQPTAEPDPLNDIPAKQNGERGQLLMRARQQTYARAVRLQVLQLVGVVLVPTIGAVVGIYVPELRAAVAAMSLLILGLDILVLDRWMRKLLKLAAQICELFDCDVLTMEWNKFVAGNKPQEEDIQHAAAAYPQTEKARKAIWDWYPPAVKRAPLHIARLACQRTNLWYDAKLRSRYTEWLVIIPVAIALILIIPSATAHLDFDAMVLTLAAPATPILVWSIRERNRQKDAWEAQRATIAQADALLDSVAAKGCTEAECAQKSREFQDAIYARRVANPLIFPLIYKMYRSQSEREMNAAADERLKALGY